VIAAQNIDDFVLDQILHILTAYLQIAPGIKARRVRHQLLAHAGGHGQAEVRVDVNLADCRSGKLSIGTSIPASLFPETPTVSQRSR